MNTRHCMLCGFVKDDVTAHLCAACKSDQAEVDKIVAEKKLPFWEAEALRQSSRDARRKDLGIYGRTDPRTLIPRQDVSQLKERGLI